MTYRSRPGFCGVIKVYGEPDTVRAATGLTLTTLIMASARRLVRLGPLFALTKVAQGCAEMRNAVELLATRDAVDVFDRRRQGHRCPGLPSVLRTEDLPLIACADVDLVGIRVMQADRHDRAMHLHLIEALPGLARVLAAINASVLASRRDAERAVHRFGILRGNPHIPPIGDWRELFHLQILPCLTLVG